MIRRLVLTGAVCAAILGLSCDRRAARVQPQAEPARQAEGVVRPAELALSDGPAVEFPREPLSTFGNTRLRHENPIDSLAFRPDGKVLAVAAEWDPVVRLWDTATGREVRRITIPGAQVWARVMVNNRTDDTQAGVVGFTPDGRRLVLRRGPDALVYDPKTGEKIMEIAGAVRCGAAISPDGRTLFGYPPSNHLTLWAIDTGKIAHDFGPLVVADCYGVCFSPDGTQVAAYMLHHRTGVVFVAPTDGTAKPEVRFSVGVPNNTTLDLANWHQNMTWVRADRAILFWNSAHHAIDPVTGKEVARKAKDDGGEHLFRLHLAPGGRVFGCAGRWNQVIELDPDTLARTPLAGVNGGKFQHPPLAVSADGKLLAVPDHHAVRLYDLAAGKFLHTDLDAQPVSPAHILAFTPDSRRVIASGYDGVRIWDPAAGIAQSLESAHPKDALFAPKVLTSPDGRWFVGADPEFWSRLAVWDAKTGRVVYREPARPEDAGSDNTKKEGTGLLGFAPDGTVWVYHTLSGDALRLELPSGRVVETLAGFPGTRGACLSPDGHRLAVSTATVLAVRSTNPNAGWRVAERRPVPHLSSVAHPCPKPLAFTPDGRRLVTQDGDGALVVWDVTGEPAVLARRPGDKDEQNASARWVFTHSLYARVVFTPDGRRFLQPAYLGNERFGIRVFETATLGEEFRLANRTRFALSPDGRRLALAHSDTTFTVWDWEAIRGGGRNPALAPPAIAAARWARLGSQNAKLGLASVDALVADPETAVALLRDRLRLADPAHVQALVADLGSGDFETREKAEGELIALGSGAAEAVRAARGSADPEVRDRARRILPRLKPESPVRVVRSVEVLERIGSAGAKELLTAWAKAEGPLGGEAKAALDRLSKPRP